MKEKIYRKVLNMQTGNEVLEPLSEMDILKIAKEIRIKKAEYPAEMNKWKK